MRLEKIALRIHEHLKPQHMKPKTLYTYTLILASFFTLALFTSYSEKNDTPPKTPPTETGSDALPQLIHGINLKQPFNFAGEGLPMTNFDVRERLDRELSVNSYWHSSTLLNIKASTRYFPAMEKILKENEVPDDFKYLAVAESSLRNVKSPAGAKGIWQFMKNTATHYGLEVNSEVDERYHVEKATEAACKYLKSYKEQFGNWTLSAAAYNMGGPNLKKELSAQGSDSYYDLNLNHETNRYVFRIVAIKEIIKRPQNFGFYLENEDMYQPLDDYKTVEINSAIPSLANFAKEQGISYRMLKIYNPWLRSSKLTNSKGKTYQIKIPNKKF